MTKKFILWWIFSILTICCIAPVNTVDAQNDCNRFWWTCYVKDINVIDSDKEPDPTLIVTIKRTINLVLALLATIATIICIYAGIKMLLSNWDQKKYNEWWTTLKYAAIWLAIVALSRIIISAVLRFVWAAVWDDNIVSNSKNAVTNEVY